MPKQLYSIEDLPAGKVSVMPRPRGGEWLLDEIKALRASGVDVLVSLLTAPEVSALDLTEEARFCQDQGITYYELPTTDFSVPPFTEATFLFLRQLNAQISTGKHIAVHCRQGLGRSVLIAACLLVLNDIPPEQACAMLSKVRGYQVPETEEQHAWVVAFAHSQAGQR